MTKKLDPTKPDPKRARVITDPNHEPVRVVDQVSFHPPMGLDVNLTCCAYLDAPVGGDGFQSEAVIVARLRMRLGMARALVEGLTKQIAMAEAAESAMN